MTLTGDGGSPLKTVANEEKTPITPRTSRRKTCRPKHVRTQYTSQQLATPLALLPPSPTGRLPRVLLTAREGGCSPQRTLRVRDAIDPTEENLRLCLCRTDTTVSACFCCCYFCCCCCSPFCFCWCFFDRLVRWHLYAVAVSSQLQSLYPD